MTTLRRPRRLGKNITMLSGDPRKRIVFYLLVIVAASYLFFFYNLGGYSLKEPDEGRYAEIPREMVEQGNYVVPHLNYVRYFEKPPLLYWVTAASYKLFGISEWSFRFPNALVAFFCGLGLYLFARRRFSDQTAFLSASILISSFGFFAMAHIVTIDMLFGGLLFGVLLCFSEYYEGRKRSFFYSFYVFLALATLAKGPVALILVSATLIVYLYTEKKLSFLKEMLQFKGLALYVVIAAPWFIALSVKEKEFFQFFFIDQNILRFITTKHKRSGPLYYFIPVLLGGMLPWSFFLPRAAVRLWQAKELRLFVIWSCVVFFFFSISGSKLPPYILPLFPALALILGHLFASLWEKTIPVNREVAVYIGFFAIVALAGFSGVTGVIDKYIKDVTPTADILRDIKGLEAGMMVVSAAILCLLCFRTMRRFGPLFLMLGGFSLSVVIMLMLHTHVIDRQQTTKELACIINSRQPQAALLVNYDSFEETLPFYTRRRVHVADYTGELAMGAKYPDAQPFFLSEEDFRVLFDSSQPVLAVMREKKVAGLPAMVRRKINLLGCRSQRCLVANH